MGVMIPVLVIWTMLAALLWFSVADCDMIRYIRLHCKFRNQTSELVTCSFAPIFVAWWGQDDLMVIGRILYCGWLILLLLPMFVIMACGVAVVLIISTSFTLTSLIFRRK